MGLVRQVLVVAFCAWLLHRVIVLNRFFRMAGFGIAVFNHNPGSCKIFHVNGSEDIDVLPNGLAVISSGLIFHFGFRQVDPTMEHYKGMLYAFDLNNPEGKLTPLSYENFDDSVFTPHGIDLYIDPKTQEISLFVVNHAEGKHSIEIFQFDQENMVLHHKKTVVDEEIYNPNDVVAVGPDKFYITNDHYFVKSKLLRLIEVFYPMKLGTVAFYNGTSAKIVSGEFQFANGINIDESGRYVFVVNGIPGEVVVFERDNDDNLIERQRINVGVGLDNVNVDKNGDLWLAVANMAFLDYIANFSNPCPGAVLQVKLSKQEDDRVPFKVDDIREVFSNSGDGEFKCVSVASFYNGKLLVGNPFSNLMHCEVLVV
ncbi:serum paraoxonase/arylesterase 2-like [Dendronephthya gigantea]|uniref:serum paraoxonase/arylesterase 2-like n=1 Tax=Dendronephthya gigantea TaxID=151771 RepID=UPI00106A28F1|nr:serum paraoxonase/arylesterase 2-like [Dendronephthya gigantea]